MDICISQLFIEGLEKVKIIESLTSIKNYVIGLNRQKQIVIARGIVPQLLNLVEKSKYVDVRLEAIIILGSLAKGTENHLNILVEHGIVNVIMKVIFEQNSILIDACLRCFRTLIIAERLPLELMASKSTIELLLSFADLRQSFNNQSCIIEILSKLSKLHLFKILLAEVNAPSSVAHLLLCKNVDILITSVNFFSNMAYQNENAISSIMNASYNNTPLIDLVANLIQQNVSNELQLEAARCLTYFYRANGIMGTDLRIVYGVLPTLVQLIHQQYEEKIRIEAANVLAYLIEVDNELQGIAEISNHLIDSLLNLMKINNLNCKQAAYNVLAILVVYNENIYDTIILNRQMTDYCLIGLVQNDHSVRLYALDCFFQLTEEKDMLMLEDYNIESVWGPILNLWRNNPLPNDELMTLATNTIFNLISLFSTRRDPIIDWNDINVLYDLTNSPDPSIRLIAVWTLMNQAFCADTCLKTQILSIFKPDQCLRLLHDSDSRIVDKSLMLLTCLFNCSTNVNYIMSTHGAQIIQAIIWILEGPYSCNAKEGALWFLASISNGDIDKEYVLTNDEILKQLVLCMESSDTTLQETAVSCICDWVYRIKLDLSERLLDEYKKELEDMLLKLISTHDNMLFDKYDFILN